MISQDSTVEQKTDIWSGMRRTAVWENVTPQIFKDQILTGNRPAILKGLVQRWPAIMTAGGSDASMANYLKALSLDKPVLVIVGNPEINGRFFYNADLTGLNHQHMRQPLSVLLDLLLMAAEQSSPPSIYAGAVNIADHLPNLLGESKLDLLEESVQPVHSVWIGNASRIAAHWDGANNIICVLRGRRRYTLFPTEQLRNLYFSSPGFGIGGRPVSLVDFHRPDLLKFPKFDDALEHAEVAELQAGDGLYLPSLWLHYAESFDSLGVMVNHWWRDSPSFAYSPDQTMLHSLLSLRDLPTEERNAWRHIFDYYIFQAHGDPMSYLPIESRGIFGTMNAEKALTLMQEMEDFLRRQQVKCMPA
jgi:hypothetical protein